MHHVAGIFDKLFKLKTESARLLFGGGSILERRDHALRLFHKGVSTVGSILLQIILNIMDILYRIILLNDEQ